MGFLGVCFLFCLQYMTVDTQYVHLDFVIFHFFILFKKLHTSDAQKYKVFQCLLKICISKDRKDFRYEIVVFQLFSFIMALILLHYLKSCFFQNKT